MIPQNFTTSLNYVIVLLFYWENLHILRLTRQRHSLTRGLSLLTCLVYPWFLLLVRGLQVAGRILFLKYTLNLSASSCVPLLRIHLQCWAQLHTPFRSPPYNPNRAIVVLLLLHCYCTLLIWREGTGVSSPVLQGPIFQPPALNASDKQN